MSEPNQLLTTARVFVKTPDVPIGTRVGVRTSYGWLGKSFTFESVVLGDNDTTKIGLPSINLGGKFKFKSDFSDVDDNLKFGTKVSAGFDWYKGTGGGFEVTF